MGFFSERMELVTLQGTDMVHRTFRVKEGKGRGTYEDYSFDDVYIGFSNIHLAGDLRFHAKQRYNVFEMSFLLEGEQLISLTGSNNGAFVYASRQCYAAFIKDVEGDFFYGGKKPFREIKVRLGAAFFEKHRLNAQYNLEKKFSMGIMGPLIRYMDTDCVRLLTQLMEDRRLKGKKMFLEAKVLELLSGFLDESDTYDHIHEELIQKVYQVRERIDQNPDKHLAIPELAKHVNMNEFVLKKEFKRIFQSTVFEYAAHGRMELAKRLLRTTQKPVYEIAEEVGYKNATHFTAAFKKREGVTPKQFRNVK
jgi:AraC-like DNA-binding protein